MVAADHRANVTTYFDCSGHSCYAPFIKPWDPEKYIFPVETLPRLVNNTLYVSAAFSDSINVSCFDCILLEIENQKKNAALLLCSKLKKKMLCPCSARNTTSLV